MRGYIRVCIAALLALAVANTTVGGERDATSQTKTGVVRAVELATKTIFVMVTRELTFTITDDTEILQEGTRRTLAAIKPGATVNVVYSFTAERTRVASKVTVLPVTSASVGGEAVANPQPALRPGQSFSIQFPDLPPTFAELVDPNGIKPQMTVFLPRNYDADHKHPLLVFLNGGTGGRGDNPGVARALTEETDFICVNLPLFHRAAPGSAGYDMIIREADGIYMWPFHKRMLAALGRAVPNIDPDRRIIGGSSNGAHAVQEFVDQSDGEAAGMFSAFFLVNGGGRLERYDLIKGKPLLIAYGGKALRPERLAEIVAAAKAGGAALTVYEMRGVGHAFPASEYPAVGMWLRGPAIGRSP